MKNPSDKIFYKLGVAYTFNWNPENKYQFYSKGTERLRHFRNQFNELIAGLKGINYYFVIELSEPRTNQYSSGARNDNCLGPRYHVHGVIRFKSRLAIFDWLNHHLFKFFTTGVVEIDTIEDLENRIEYCRKQQFIFLDKNPPILNIPEDSICEALSPIPLKNSELSDKRSVQRS